jgi:hypothetical protein
MRLGKFKILSWICEILNDVQIQDVIGISVFFCENFHIVKNVLKKKLSQDSELGSSHFYL